MFYGSTFDAADARRGHRRVGLSFAQRPQLRLGGRPLLLRRVGILHKRACQILMHLGVDFKLDQRIVQQGLHVMTCVFEPM